MTAFDELKELDVQTFDQDQQQPPRIWWHNGNKQAKTPGSFYTKEEEIGGPPDSPWQEVEKYDGETGYVAESLKIAIIATRSQPVIIDSSGERKTYTWLTKWEKGAQIYTEILCFAEGIAEPVVWPCKGMTGKAMTGKGGILQSYEKGFLRNASQCVGKGLNPWAFWLPISTKLDSAGKPAYDDTGFKSFVTPPDLFLPAMAVTQDLMNALFVGSDLYKRGAEVRVEFDSWIKEKRGNEPVEEAAPSYAESKHTPRGAYVATPAASDWSEDVPF